MEYSPTELGVNAADPAALGGSHGFVVDTGSLFDFLYRLEDHRDPRGVRYRLAQILVFVLLAKLAGEDRLTGIAGWVWRRKEALAQALGLQRPPAPHRTTYSRIWGEKLAVEALERLLGDFCASEKAGEQLIQMTSDGKTLRGSIPAGQTGGVHLRAAYLPGAYLPGVRSGAGPSGGGKQGKRNRGGPAPAGSHRLAGQGGKRRRQADATGALGAGGGGRGRIPLECEADGVRSRASPNCGRI